MTKCAIALAAIGCLLVSTARAQQSPTFVRVRLPDTAALAEADAKIVARYAQDQNNQATAADVLVIVQRMNADADNNADSAERYLLRWHSSMRCAKAGLWRQALHGCDRLCGEFNVPHAYAHHHVVAAINSNFDQAKANGLDDAALAALQIDTIEGLLIEDKYVEALKISSDLKARPGCSSLAQEYDSLAGRLQAAYASEAAPALDILKKQPLHAAAHQRLADFYFQQKGDWEAALPHYALGTQAAIKALALRELAHPQDHATQHRLATDYRTAGNGLSTKAERNWCLKRASYWQAVAATSEQAFANRRGMGPTLPSQPDDVASFAPRIGHGPTRRGTPVGASLLLTFDQSFRQTGSSRVQYTLSSGATVTGERATVFDLSPRRNHVEGLLISTGAPGLMNLGWHSNGAPLVCSERLIGQLPGFTWAAWIFLDSSHSGASLLEEPSEAPKFPAPPKPGLVLRMDQQRGVTFASPLAHHELNASDRQQFSCRLDGGNLSGRWVFAALTVDYTQRVRITLDHQTVVQPMGLLAPRPAEGLTLLAGSSGRFDNVVFYPRPLSEAEITTLYHRGLTRQPLAEYSQDGSVTSPPTPTFPPRLYVPSSQLANNNIPNVPPSSQANANDPPRSPSPKPKSPKPSDNEIKDARAVIRDLYSADFTKATTVDKRRELAAKLKQVGQDSRDSASSRYACLYEAADLLSDADVPEAYDAWDELGREFDVPVAREKGAVLERMQKKAKVPSDHKYVADRYVRLLNEALDHDDYPLALSFATRAEACVKRAGDDALEKTIDKGVKDLRQMMAAFETAKVAKETLSTKPDDPVASAAWGKYLCLYRGKWDDGLSLLARGSDELAALAKRDVSNPDTTKLQTDLAAAWWKSSETEKDERAQTQLRSRAVFWYQKVVGSLSGIQAAQAKQRITDHLTAISPLPTKKPFDALAMVDVAAHGLTGRWQKDRGAIAVVPNRSSGAEVAIPVALHGSYEMLARVEWQGKTGTLYIRLPVADKAVVLAIGSNMGVMESQGADLVGFKSLQPSSSLDAGRRYDISTAVVMDDENVEITVGLNGRPYLSWSGTVKDLDMNGRNNGFGMPNRGAPGAAPMIRFHSRSIDPFAVLGLQLNVTRGWAEPVLNVGPAIGSSRTGFGN